MEAGGGGELAPWATVAPDYIKNEVTKEGFAWRGAAGAPPDPGPIALRERERE